MAKTKLRLTELLKTSLAFTAVSATGVDSALMFADRAGLLRFDSHWYLTAPMGVITVVSLPTAFRLLDRLSRMIDNGASGRIVGTIEGMSPHARRIPINGGVKGHIMALTAPARLQVPEERIRELPAKWIVPVDEVTITVREGELRTFLEAAYKRTKFQFSRRYWTQTRRPAIWRPKYEAFMRLLNETGVIDDREERRSGRISLFPREAIMYLKYESQYRVA